MLAFWVMVSEPEAPRLGTFALITLLAATLACGRARSLFHRDAGAGAHTFALDTAHAVSGVIEPTKSHSLGTADGRAGVMFLPGSVAVATHVELVPIARPPLDPARALAPGFVVRKKGDTAQHLALAGSALVRFRLPGPAPARAGVVRYSDDGKGFTPIRSQVQSDGTITLVQAELTGFSGVGLYQLTPEESSRAVAEDASGTWTIGVHQPLSKQVAIWKIDYRIDFDATSRTGLLGAYQGPATITARGKATNTAGPVFTRTKLDTQSRGTARFEFPLQFPRLVPSEPGSPRQRNMAGDDWAVAQGRLDVQTSGGYDAFGSGPGAAVAKQDRVAPKSEQHKLTVSIKDGEVSVELEGLGSVPGVLSRAGPAAAPQPAGSR